MSANKPAPMKSKRIAGFLRRLRDDQAGNTFLILGAGIFPILGMIGGAVDIGRQYMTQARLQVACDAGALAARRVMANPATLSRWYFIVLDRSLGRLPSAWCMVMWWTKYVSGVSPQKGPSTQGMY